MNADSLVTFIMEKESLLLLFSLYLTENRLLLHCLHFITSYYMTEKEIQANKVELAIFVVDEFAKKYRLKFQQAFNYLCFHGGLQFLMQHYNIEHTLPFDDIVSDVALVCRNKGGELG